VNDYHCDDFQKIELGKCCLAHEDGQNSHTEYVIGDTLAEFFLHTSQAPSFAEDLFEVVYLKVQSHYWAGLLTVQETDRVGVFCVFSFHF